MGKAIGGFFVLGEIAIQDIVKYGRLRAKITMAMLVANVGNLVIYLLQCESTLL